MISSVEISNFRGIKHLRLHNLGRLNVIVGPNGTAKTALLEGIYLAGGNTPENLLKTKQWRGREGGEVSGDIQVLQNALWADTFRDPDAGDAFVQIIDHSGNIRDVKIERIAPTRVIGSEGVAGLTHVGMKFTWQAPEGRSEIIPKLSAQGIMMETAHPGPGVHFLPARMNVSEAETARTYSRLSVEGRADTFEKAFYSEFPWLSDVGVEAPGIGPALYARMANGRKLPLTMISGGISHLAGMMVRLAANPGCMLLIDEIENGFYYDRYESIWRTLFSLAESSDSQVFATSHSLECLKALSRALPGAAKDIRFIRSRMSSTADVSFQQMSGDGLFKAIEIGEVR